jgi:hypothetical protein
VGRRAADPALSGAKFCDFGANTAIDPRGGVG